MSEHLSDGQTFNLILLLAALAALGFVSFSKWLQSYWLPLPLLSLTWGALIGPPVLGWVSAEAFPGGDLFLREATRLVLAIALMAIALRLPHGFWARHRRFVVVILGLGMAAMWLTAGVVISLFTAYGLLTSLLLAAIVTPTDPVVSSPIVTGPIARANVPRWLRFGISAESGSNDGLGLLFVLLPLFLLKHGDGAEGWQHWLVHGLLKEIMLAIGIGFGCGALAARMYRLMKDREAVQTTALLAFTLIFPIVVLTLTRLLQADGILAVFIAGAVYGQREATVDEGLEEEAQEAVNKVVMVLFFVVVGVHLPIREWGPALGLTGMLGWVAVLVTRRFLPVLLLQRLLRKGITPSETAFLGWFAPVGAAAVYYTKLSEHELERSDLWLPISFVITASVVIHGLTSTPLTRRFGRATHHGRE